MDYIHEINIIHEEYPIIVEDILFNYELNYNELEDLDFDTIQNIYNDISIKIDNLY